MAICDDFLATMEATTGVTSRLSPSYHYMPTQSKGRARSSRHHQQASKAGLGRNYTSPLKLRDPGKHRTVAPLGHETTTAALWAQFQALRANEPNSSPDDPTETLHETPEPTKDEEMGDWEDMEASILLPVPVPIPSHQVLESTPARLKQKRQALAWDNVIPHLLAPLATFRLASHFQEIEVTTCKCVPVSALLVGAGLFPAAPTRPEMAVSIDLLDIYRALFERSCDAVTALAAALHTTYMHRGFQVVTRSDSENFTKDPYRGPLGNAIQWYSILRSRLRNQTNIALDTAQKSLVDPFLPPMEASPSKILSDDAGN
ncbi:hypothetical protein K438DRAFT_2134438 [Mycena galopus ATCC 62051]|nr:hypothetical protein K438DRAFT_2134438 [Mycena galopus ATCC 62051]